MRIPRNAFCHITAMLFLYDRKSSTFQTKNLTQLIKNGFERLKNYSHDFGVKIVT